MKNQKKIFFIGIGGKGLNGIAKICIEKGYLVGGVDSMVKNETTSLESAGAKIFYSHSANNLDGDTDIVVYSSLTKNTPEIKKAKLLNIKCMKRSKFLKFITKNNFKICIAGSHGKSTTTTLIGLSSVRSGLDATIYGGAYTKEFSGYNHFGKSKYAIIEACEYDRSFFDLIGNHTVITSIEKSHLEYYKTEHEMIRAFEQYVGKHDAHSKIFINGDCMKSRYVTRNFKGKLVTFGFSPRNDYYITDVFKTESTSKFSIFYLGEKIIGNLEINIPGDYNILNFVATVAVLNELKLPLNGIFKTARTFMGVMRRFEISKNRSGQILIDDFAHHPTQVKYLFDGIKQFYPNNKICAVFQPRQFNIIKNFLKEYGESFKFADEVLVTDILPALGDTDKDIKSVTTDDLIKSIKRNSKCNVKHVQDFPNVVKYIKSNYDAGSVITTIGAGDIYKVRDSLMA